MDFRVQRTEHTAAVPLGGGIAVGVVLRGGTGSGRESALDAVDRRAIPRGRRFTGSGGWVGGSASKDTRSTQNGYAG